MIRDKQLDAHHHLDPDKRVFVIYDRRDQYYSKSYFLTYDAAMEACGKANARHPVSV